MVREYYRVKESNTGQFAGVRINYHVWSQRFIATVHSQTTIRGTNTSKANRLKLVAE
jgi:hypothetical protein